MDQTALVESHIDDGHRLIDQLAADGHPVEAAFWAKTIEEGIWFLYAVTEDVDKFGPAGAYRAVYDALKKLENSSISISELKVLSPKNPIAQGAKSLTHQRDLGVFAHFGVGVIPGMEEGYIYVHRTKGHSSANGNQMTTEEVAQAVLRLMNRNPGILEPSQVALKDGTAFSGVPFSLQLGRGGAMVIQFVVDHEHVPRVVPLADIASIK